ncbi:MAG: hypothetical protein ACLQDI_06810 [Syntrophobacteraceae bacterium]
MTTSLRKYSCLASTLVLAMLSCLLGSAMAADVRTVISGNGSFRALIIEGEIEPGDFDIFIKALRDNQGLISSVNLFSPGGDFNEAMKIGRAIRALELHSQAPMLDPHGKPFCENDDTLGLMPKDPKNCNCSSACFFIHIGAVHRGGTFLAVHRPYFNQTQFRKLTEVQAKKEFESLQNRARDYMQEMGVPKHIQEDVLGTPSDRALILDEKTVKTYFWGDLPYRHEWLKAKCSRLSDDERMRWDAYLRESITRRGQTGMSRSEPSDLQSLQQKAREEMDCDISLTSQSRISAYEKYFGVKPTDYANHNFSRWAEAPKYLGRSFDDILGEEKFEEGKILRGTMERSATATAPSLTLFDSPSNPRAVISIHVISQPSASQEFIQRLIKTLEKAWGSPSGMNTAAGKGGLLPGSTCLALWNKDGFRAKLERTPGTAKEGPLVILSIEATR